MKNLRQRTLIAATLSICTACGFGFLMATMAAPAMAQFTSTQQDPYVSGVYVNPPGVPVSNTPAPPVGCGSIPWGVTPGQSGPASLMPWVPNIPANTANQSSTQLSLPYGPSSLTPPGVLGPALQGSIPAPPSTPGAIPTILQTPQAGAYAAEVTVPAGGVLPDGSAPTSRSGRQFTQNFGLQSTTTSYNTDFGIQPSLNPNVAQVPQVSQDQPHQTTYPGQYGTGFNSAPSLPNAFQVNMGTGAHTQFQGSGVQAVQVIAPY